MEHREFLGDGTILYNPLMVNIHHLDFPCGSVVKNLSANAGNKGLRLGSGRSPGEGNGNPLQYSCL